MPHRSKDELESWLKEFSALDYLLADQFRILEQDADDGSGLVSIFLGDADTSTYIQPSEDGGRWIVTFEPREDPVELDAPGVSRLAMELITISALCAFLQSKSAATTATQLATS